MGMSIAFFNRKGGVSKTSSCLCMASVFEMLGHKVLVVDCDPQGNSSQSLRVYDPQGKGIRETLLDPELPMENLVRISPNSNICCIPSSEHHASTAKDLYIKAEREKTDTNTILRSRLDRIKENYSYILLDMSPSMDTVSMAALVAADVVITPVEADLYSYEGISSVLDIIKNIQENYNPGLQFAGVLLTRCETRTTLFTQVYRQFREKFRDYYIQQPIRKDNAVREAMAMCMPLLRYQKRSRAGTDYIKAMYEIGLINDTEYKKAMEWHGMKNDNFKIS